MEDNVDKIVNDYRFVVSGDEYTAPEIRRFHLQGTTPWKIGEDGLPMKMTSSPIVSIKGRVVTTKSGSTYILGTRAEGFPTVEELREKHPHVRLEEYMPTSPELAYIHSQMSDDDPERYYCCYC